MPKSRTEQIRRHLQLFGGGQVRIRIGKPKRSSRANRFYWSAIIGAIHEAMIDAGIGYVETNDGIKMVTAQMIHELFKAKYLPVRAVVMFGEDVTLPPSTTELDSTQFSDYISAIKDDEQVRQLSVHFEDPGEEWKSFSIEEIGF